MRELTRLPPSFATTRDALHRVAVHVLARRRHALAARIGLRAAPGGFATVAAGPDHEVVRTSGAWLVRERTGDAATTMAIDLRACTISDAAALVEVDLDEPFDAGHDTPPVGDRTAPLTVDAAAAHALGDWYAFGWSVLDEVVAGLGPDASPTVVQLWPEHFDAGCDVAAAGSRVNLGASGGDAAHAEPYLYVGPWGPDRPGGDGYWNAPFGAVLGHGELVGAADPRGVALAFLREGVRRLEAARS